MSLSNIIKSNQENNNKNKKNNNENSELKKLKTLDINKITKEIKTDNKLNRKTSLMNQKNINLMGEVKEKSEIKEEGDEVIKEFWKLQEDFCYTIVKKFKINDSNKNSNKFLIEENEKKITENRTNFYRILDGSTKKLQVSKCEKISFGVLFCFFYPLLILLISIFLGIFIGVSNIFIGALLLIVGAFFPITFILYLTASDLYKKNFYWFLFSLIWLSILVILKGVYEILKGIFYGLFLFLRAICLICGNEINNENNFSENLRIGLGNLKMKEIKIIDKFMENKTQKEIVKL